MDGNIKLSATVISCMGNESDRDDFYFNGNFANCHNTQSIQCSFEKSSDNYIFAISDSMGTDNGEMDNISAVREIKRYHESAKKQQFSLETITEKIYEAVQLSSNLIYSKSVIANQNNPILTGFSSLIIDNNRAVIMNLGNNGAFLFRQGLQREIFSKGESRKNEKLKMLGITPNSTDIYNDTEKILKLAEEESKTKIKLSSTIELEEGDIILLCSDGLLEGLNRSRIESVIDSGMDPSKMASILFQEAAKNSMEQGITIMVAKVEEVRELPYFPLQRKLERFDFEDEQENEPEEPEKSRSVVNYILGFICVIIISGVLFMGYLIIRNSGLLSSGGQAVNTTQTTDVPTNTTAFATSTQSGNTDSTSQNSQEQDTNSDNSNSSDKGSDNNASDSSSDDSPSKSSDSGKSQAGSSNDNKGQGTADKPSEQNSGDADTQNESSEYSVHTVQPGETLSSISTKYYGTPGKYDLILKYNNLKNADTIKAGDQLKIPKAD